MICSDTDFVTGIGVCGWILFGISWLLVFVTLPFSLCVLLKVPSSYYFIQDHHLHHRWCIMVTKAMIVLIIISFLKWSWLMIKTATRWCKNIKIFTRWCKNMREPWYSDSVVSYLEEQRALVSVLHKDNYLGSFSSIHIRKGKNALIQLGCRSIWFQEYSLCCRASRLTKRSTWGQSPSEFHLKRWAF